MRQLIFALAISFLSVVATFSQQLSTVAAPDRIPRHVKPAIRTSTSSGDTVISQVADGGGWSTVITIMNVGRVDGAFSLSCYGDDGNPIGFSWNIYGMSSGFSGNVFSNGMVEVSTTGTAAVTSQGWCYLDSSPSGTGDIAGFAIFRYAPTGQEVSVNAEAQLASSLTLAFDNTNGYSYGVALVNSDNNLCGSASDQVSVTIRDNFGGKIGSGALSLASCGHTSFILADQFPATANQIGSVTFALTGGTTLSGLGLRASPSGSVTSVALVQPLTN